jgi:excisionase family DNA binding protein
MPRKPDPRRIKRHRVYSVAEAAEALGMHRQSVLRWIKSGGLAAETARKPWLIAGEALKAFLGERRGVGRCRLALAQIYCLGCRAARIPDGRLADFTLRSQGAGMLTGLCAECGRVMHKAVRRADLEMIRAQLEVHVIAAQPRIVGSTDAPVIVDLARESRTHGKKRVG